MLKQVLTICKLNNQYVRAFSFYEDKLPYRYVKKTEIDTSQKEKLNPDITKLPFAETFACKNTRSLELLGLGPKPKGFCTQRHLIRYYNQLFIECTNRHITAYILNNCGLRIAEASTREFEIAKYLYRTSDVNAATNIGRVLAERCCMVGVHRMVWDTKNNLIRSGKKKFLAVFAGIKESGKIHLDEPEILRNYPQAVSNYLEYYRPDGYQELAVWVSKFLETTVKIDKE